SSASVSCCWRSGCSPGRSRAIRAPRGARRLAVAANLDFLRRRGRLHTALFIAIGLTVSGVAVMAYGLHLFERVELSTVDARFSLRGKLPPPKDVVVVGVDDVTFSQTGLRWPFPRSVQSKVIDRLTAAGAKVIAEDIQYTERTT